MGDGDGDLLPEPIENFNTDMDIRSIEINDDHIFRQDVAETQGSIRIFIENFNSHTTPSLGNLPVDPEDEMVYDN